jgi:nucleoside-diphosphate-sugar epimerase
MSRAGTVLVTGGAGFIGSRPMSATSAATVASSVSSYALPLTVSFISIA